MPGANNSRLQQLRPRHRCTLCGINYFPYNFNSTGDNGNAGKIFNQLYFRQAMQILVDQPLFDPEVFKGYGVPTYGPVPVLPPNPFASAPEKNNPYPYNVSKAKSLLSSHGWKVVAQRHRHLHRPGNGHERVRRRDPGRGAKLNFTPAVRHRFDLDRAAHERREVVVGPGRHQRQR